MAMGINPNTITSANAIVQVRCAGIFDTWVNAEGAQSDAFLSFGDVTTAQTEIGIDGKLSFGWIPHKTTGTISLMANSPSIKVFETIYNDFLNNREVRLVELRVTYPSVKRMQSLSGTIITKSGGTGLGQLLTGHTYVLEGISSGIEETN